MSAGIRFQFGTCVEPDFRPVPSKGSSRLMLPALGSGTFLLASSLPGSHGLQLAYRLLQYLHPGYGFSALFTRPARWSPLFVFFSIGRR